MTASEFRRFELRSVGRFVYEQFSEVASKNGSRVQWHLPRTGCLRSRRVHNRQTTHRVANGVCGRVTGDPEVRNFAARKADPSTHHPQAEESAWGAPFAHDDTLPWGLWLNPRFAGVWFSRVSGARTGHAGHPGQPAVSAITCCVEPGFHRTSWLPRPS